MVRSQAPADRARGRDPPGAPLNVKNVQSAMFVRRRQAPHLLAVPRARRSSPGENPLRQEAALVRVTPNTSGSGRSLLRPSRSEGEFNDQATFTARRIDAT